MNKSQSYAEIFRKHYDYLYDNHDTPPKGILYMDLVGAGDAMVKAGLPFVKQTAIEREDWFTSDRERAALALALFEICGGVFLY